MIYEKYEIVSNDNPHLYKTTSEYWEVSLEDLLAFSQAPCMNDLTVDDVKAHNLGCSVVGSWYGLPFPDHYGVLSYAGITGTEQLQGKRCAVIGGVLVHPDYREIGIGSLTVNWLVQTASSTSFHDKLGHDGLMARCNAISTKLFARLGFVAVKEEKSKTIMYKSLIQ